MTRREQMVVTVLAILGLGFLAWGSKKSPGGSVKVPATVSEVQGLVFIPPPGAPMMAMADHVGPYGLVYTPHRYPSACGSEITTLIHRGYHTMALPHEQDTNWLRVPPGEAEL